MVRKSERTKASAEKVEKPTSSRKTTRSTRRRKKSTTESEPEAEAPKEATTDEIPLPPPPQVPTEETPEVPEVKEGKSRRGRPPRHAPTENTTVQPEESRAGKEEWNEDENFWGETSKAAPAESQKPDDEKSTWKIQSSNGSGGVIQKLKICRQRLTDSAESSSSPAKEASSPRRKRYSKRKEKHLEGDGAESTGSHTDTEAPTSAVVDTTESVTVVCEPSSAGLEVESVIHQEIPLPQGERIIQEADSAPVNQAQENDTVAGGEASAIEAEPEQLTESVERGKIETVVADADQETVEVKEQQDPKANEVSPSEDVTEEASTDVTCVVSEELVPIVSDDHSEVAGEVLIEPVELVEEPEREQLAEGPESAQLVEDPETGPGPEPVSVEPAVSEPPELSRGESKPAKKTHKKNLKLAVSHEDAMQQIAMKLNERAARFSKEATEEVARRLAPAKPHKENAVAEEEEEGEISRDPTSTKTLDLKRLDDDDVEPANKKRERCRRPVTDTPSTPSTPSRTQKDLASDASKHDVSTVILKALLPTDVIQPVAEEELQSVFSPKEDELEAHQINSDDAGSAREVGEVEEEGELIEEESEDKKRSAEDRHDKHSKRHRSSRDEAKKPERRVTKEPSKKGSKGDRKDGRSSVDEPRTKKKYERDESKKEGRRSGEKSDQAEAPRIEENHKTVRKISLVPEGAKSIRSVSPPTKKPSSVLFITNLVRPFTIMQLKELLARTGTIAPDGFHIDNIKSKCFVKYDDVDMAIETRHSLHGVKWPTTNPRTLKVEFSTEEAMEAVKKIAEEEDNDAKRQDLAAQNHDKSWYPRAVAEKEVVKPLKRPKNLVREWDMGKDVSEIVPIQESIKKGKEEEWGVKAKDKHGDKEEVGRRRHVSPTQENAEPARKVKRTDAPAKLLDDLFRRTKATPCIYWLPLTAAQIAVKEEMRRQHMAEHQKRLDEMRKTDTSRRDKDKSRDRDRDRERARDRRRK